MDNSKLNQVEYAGARAHARNRILNVLIACEESQAECTAFRELGHNAYSCDIQPCRRDGRQDWHIQGNALPYIRGAVEFECLDGSFHNIGHWDLIICHPPCTFLCRSSCCVLYKQPVTECIVDDKVIIANKDRVEGMLKGRAFFYECLNAKAYYVAVENPVPMKLAGLPRPSFFANPSWFGVKYSKKTCYWVRGLPPIMASLDYPNPKCYVKSSRGKYRSRTFPQLARALALQWSEYIINEQK